MRWRKTKKGEPSRWKLLLWTAVASLVFGLIGMGEAPEDALRAARNKLHEHQASGDIVFVAIDEKSLREVGRWPWPRRQASTPPAASIPTSSGSSMAAALPFA